jgi:predicted nucleic acid-binding protein
MISNATPIICLAKINQIELLKKLFSHIMITEQVKEEVLIEGKPGYSIIIDSISRGWIKVLEPKENFEFKGLGKGENSSINLAKEKNDTLIIDDCYAIKIANSLGLSHIRTTTVILLAYKKNIITKKQAILYINNLVEIGYYIAPKFYIKIIEFLNTDQ